MAQVSRITMPNTGASYASSTTGTSPAWAPVVAGDLFAISGGRGTLLGFRTTGTAITVTLNNVVLSNYGTDVDVTVVLASTDEQWVFIPSDGSKRFDQGPGSGNDGFVAVSYSTTTGGNRAAVTIQ